MRHALSFFFVVVVGCAGGNDGTTTTSSGPSGDAMPAPIDVCIRENGVLTASTASASRAGTYDPDAPIVPEYLNWMVPESHCVAYPGAATERALCGTRTTEAPVVERALCQQ